MAAGVLMTMGRHCSSEALENAKPVVGMVISQVMYGGVMILYRVMADDGMNLRIVIAYRFLLGSAVLIPLAIVFERKKRPKLTWMVLLQAFGCGLLGGTMAQNLSLASVSMTSATYGTAMNNLIPAFTFVFAILLGSEKLRIKSVEGMAKVMGTLIEIGGAMVMTLYKGPEIHIWPTHHRIMHHDDHGSRRSSHAQSGNLLAGSMLAVGSCLAYALFLILQAKLSKRYPGHFSILAIMLPMSSVQAVVVALCGKREWSEWKIGWNKRLLAILYMGMVGSGIFPLLLTWCIAKRGPLFTAVFNPLCLVFVAIVGSIFLGETLHLGSLLGAVLIVGGLYLVVWGKGREMKVVRNQTALPSTVVVEDAVSSDHDRDHIVVKGDKPPVTTNGSTAAPVT